MTAIPARLRRLVVERAAGRCEYCGLSQEGQEATFHADHIVPVSADGRTTAGNLALACIIHGSSWNRRTVSVAEFARTQINSPSRTEFLRTQLQPRE